MMRRTSAFAVVAARAVCSSEVTMPSPGAAWSSAADNCSEIAVNAGPRPSCRSRRMRCRSSSAAVIARARDRASASVRRSECAATAAWLATSPRSRSVRSTERLTWRTGRRLERAEHDAVMDHRDAVRLPDGCAVHRVLVSSPDHLRAGPRHEGAVGPSHRVDELLERVTRVAARLDAAAHLGQHRVRVVPPPVGHPVDEVLHSQAHGREVTATSAANGIDAVRSLTRSNDWRLATPSA